MSRKIYSFLDFLGEIGGVFEIIILVFGFLLLPLSRHSFILSATKEMYLAKTKEANIFKPVQQEDKEFLSVYNGDEN